MGHLRLGVLQSLCLSMRAFWLVDPEAGLRDKRNFPGSTIRRRGSDFFFEKNTGDTGAVQTARRLTGPKKTFFFKKNVNSDGSKSDPRDLMFVDQPMTLVFSRLNSNPELRSEAASFFRLLTAGHWRSSHLGSLRN